MKLIDADKLLEKLGEKKTEPIHNLYKDESLNTFWKGYRKGYNKLYKEIKKIIEECSVDLSKVIDPNLLFAKLSLMAEEIDISADGSQRISISFNDFEVVLYKYLNRVNESEAK